LQEIDLYEADTSAAAAARTLQVVGRDFVGEYYSLNVLSQHSFVVISVIILRLS
jgi:hypothetical protein